MDNFTSLIVGIVSSLIATATFILLSELARRVVLPWYEDRIYRGVRIDGEWILDSLDGNHVDCESTTALISKFTFAQKAERIAGEYMHTDKESKPDLYQVTGRIRDGYLAVIMEPKSRRSIDAGVGLFHIRSEQGALRLFGVLSYAGDPGEVEVEQKVCYKTKNA